MAFDDDKEGKAVGIHTFIGRKPILAFGNSDGDQQMLEYTDSGVGPRLMLLVHHDDAEREYAYDPDAWSDTPPFRQPALAAAWRVSPPDYSLVGGEDD